MTVKICTVEDVDWLMRAARVFFGDRIKDYSGSQRWVEAALSNPSVKLMRTEDAAIVAVKSVTFFDPKSPEIIVQFFGGRREGIVKLFHAVKDWASENGANKIYFRPRTGYNAAPLAEELGAEQDYPSYTWSF